MAPVARLSGRATAVVAWATAAVAAGCAAGAAALAVGTGDEPVKPLVLTVVWLVPGVLIAVARPRLVLGWLALGQALLFAGSALADAWIHHGGAGPGAGAAWATWVTDRFSAFLAVGVWLVLVLLPDGRLPTPRWRPLVVGVVVLQCAVLTVFLTARGPAAGPDTELPAWAREVANPVGVLPESWGAGVVGLDIVVLQAPLLLCLAAYVHRLRRSAPDERARTVAVLLSAATFVLLVVLGHAWLPAAAPTLDVVASCLLAAQLTATVLGARPRLVEDVTGRAFVLTVLTAALGAVTVGAAHLVELWGRPALSPSGIAVLAVVATLGVAPVRRRLTRWVEDLLHGDVADPYRALQHLAERTHRAPDVDAVLQGVAASAAASLRVPWSAVEAAGRELAWGRRPPGEEVSADLVVGGARIGRLAVAPGPGRRLRSDEVDLLADLGRHGGVAVQAAVLADDVRAGRQRLVLAREEERLRLRRDLHDEVGPTLAGLAMQLGTVRTLVGTDPAAAADRLGRLQEAAQQALGTVRRISHDLRPPALDELGVVGALRQRADALGLAAAVTGTDDVRLPAAVEVAVYRIGSEALHNVARHAGAPEVEVEVVRAEPDVLLRVRDHGRGMSPGRSPGVGLAAMRERADELGGSVTVGRAPGGGTEILARLPAHTGVRT